MISEEQEAMRAAAQKLTDEPNDVVRDLAGRVDQELVEGQEVDKFLELWNSVLPEERVAAWNVMMSTMSGDAPDLIRAKVIHGHLAGSILAAFEVQVSG